MRDSTENLPTPNAMQTDIIQHEQIALTRTQVIVNGLQYRDGIYRVVPMVKFLLHNM
jgi:hypothetical protein